MSSSWKLREIVRDSKSHKLVGIESLIAKRNEDRYEMHASNVAVPTSAANTSRKRKAPTTQAEPARKSSRSETKKTAGSKSRTIKAATGPKKGGRGGGDEPPKKPAPAPKAPKRKLAAINHAPTDKLNVYVFGEGSNGELGLGHMNSQERKVTDVKRPRLNPNLEPETVGVVQVAVGGMHAAALTYDNKILTWGVNDQGALGRPTKQADQFKHVGADEEKEEHWKNANGTDKWIKNTGLNPLESAPHPVSLENVPEGTIFTHVACGDSVTMAVTDTGLVYGCGTFRSNEGILGFTAEVETQTTLTQVHGLKNIVSTVCGDNHVVALDSKGNAFTFGSGQQNQLGRRVIERTRMNGLLPRDFGLPKNKMTHIAAGAYHSFAISKTREVWTWGLNNFGETGIPEGAGEDGAMVLKPTVVHALDKHHVTSLAGGAHHSLAVTAEGKVLVWGRVDGAQAGVDLDEIPEGNFIVDKEGNVSKRSLVVPTVVPAVEGKAVHVAAGTDQCVAITEAGKAYTWGFSENYQTGQGTTEDVEVATLLDNTAVRDQKLNWAGAGGQFTIVTSIAE